MYSFILSLLTSPYFCSSLIALPFISTKRDLHDTYPRNFNEWTQHYLGMKPQIQVHIYIRKAFIQKRTFYTDYNSIYHLRLFSRNVFWSSYDSVHILNSTIEPPEQNDLTQEIYFLILRVFQTQIVLYCCCSFALEFKVLSFFRIKV